MKRLEQIESDFSKALKALEEAIGQARSGDPDISTLLLHCAARVPRRIAFQ